MTEVGPVSYECPKNPCRLHVMEESFIAEIVDPKTGASIARGQRGELVLTTLVRAGSPVFRYRTGDLVQARVQPECNCGSRELSLEGGILGRVDDMVLVRGVNVFPSAVEEIIRSFPEVSEFRVTLKNSEMEIEIECARESVAGALQKAMQTTFALRVPVRVVAANSLPRSEMKSKRWVRA